MRLAATRLVDLTTGRPVTFSTAAGKIVFRGEAGHRYLLS